MFILLELAVAAIVKLEPRSLVTTIVYVVSALINSAFKPVIAFNLWVNVVALVPLVSSLGMAEPLIVISIKAC